MVKAINIIGKKFNKLTVISKEPKNKLGEVRWLCQCECGNKTIILSYYIRKGITRSCGCLMKELAKIRKTTHNFSRTSTYHIWQAMKNRCENPKSSMYKYYGGKGIKVCERWNTFTNFLTDMGERPIKKSIDRINNDGNYEPGNCRWATNFEQSRNTNRNHIIFHNGKSHCLSDWAALLNIPHKTLSNRLYSGWTIERAFSTPFKTR